MSLLESESSPETDSAESSRLFADQAEQDASSSAEFQKHSSPQSLSPVASYAADIAADEGTATESSPVMESLTAEIEAFYLEAQEFATPPAAEAGLSEECVEAIPLSNNVKSDQARKISLKEEEPETPIFKEESAVTSDLCQEETDGRPVNLKENDSIPSKQEPEPPVGSTSSDTGTTTDDKDRHPLQSVASQIGASPVTGIGDIHIAQENQTYMDDGEADDVFCAEPHPATLTPGLISPTGTGGAGKPIVRVSPFEQNLHLESDCTTSPGAEWGRVRALTRAEILRRNFGHFDLDGFQQGSGDADDNTNACEELVAITSDITSDDVIDSERDGKSVTPTSKTSPTSIEEAGDAAADSDIGYESSDDVQSMELIIPSRRRRLHVSRVRLVAFILKYVLFLLNFMFWVSHKLNVYFLFVSKQHYPILYL
jgi:hypothetical protein